MDPLRRHALMLLCFDQTFLVLVVAAFWMVVGLAFLDPGTVIVGLIALIAFALALGVVTVYLSETEGRVAQRVPKQGVRPSR